ncbi:MAG: GYDIA family GHMP kinase [Saprospiraceae bacterium]
MWQKKSTSHIPIIFFYICCHETKGTIKHSFRGNGKLLLTAEYAVLDGALALAVPTRPGQTMNVKDGRGAEINWKSYDTDGKLWFEAHFSLYDFSAIKTSDEEKAKIISKLLKECTRQNSEFLSAWKGQTVETYLDFPLEWGLGSSSSLIYCVSQWADANPYYLLFNTTGGSGYDIACAYAEGPLVYQLGDESIRIDEVYFNPPFKDNLYFLYLGKKQDSQQAVNEYKSKPKPKSDILDQISTITEEIVGSKKLSEFHDLIKKHETIISSILNKPSLHSTQFADFKGTVKSLGAWGGDFALVASDENMDHLKAYFTNKGFSTLIPYNELVLTA